MSQCTDKAQKFQNLKERVSTLKTKDLNKYKSRPRRELSSFMNEIREVLNIQTELLELENFGFTHEDFMSKTQPALRNICKDNWGYSEQQLKIFDENVSKKENVHIGEPIHFDQLKEENKNPNPNKAGEIYLTSELIDFENAKVFIPEIPSNIASQKVAGVMKYIYETYKDDKRYIIPDIRYYLYLIELGEQHKNSKTDTEKEQIKNKIPEELLDHTKHFFFTGSAFVDEFGDWCCPGSDWLGDKFDRGAFGLGYGWSSRYRVVFLER